MEYNFLGGKSSYILEVKNAVPKDICNSLVSECLKYYEKLFSPGPTIGGINPFIKNTMDFNFSRYYLSQTDIPLEPFGSYEDIITDSLFSCVALYQNTFRELWNWPGLRDTGFRLQRYAKNFGFYRQHVDGTPWTVDGDVYSRVLAGIVYLNDVHSGGETFFPEHDVAVKPQAGTIAIFPAAWTHPHQGNAPLTNDKWMISTFYTCDKDRPVQAQQELEAPKDVDEEDSSKKNPKEASV